MLLIKFLCFTFLFCGEKNGKVKHKIRESRGQCEGFKVIHKRDDGMVPGETLMLWFIYHFERNYLKTWWLTQPFYYILHFYGSRMRVGHSAGQFGFIGSKQGSFGYSNGSLYEGPSTAWHRCIFTHSFTHMHHILEGASKMLSFVKCLSLSI